MDSTNQSTTGDANSGASAQGTGANNELAQAIAGAVAAAVSTVVSTSLNELKAQITALKSSSTVDDTNLEVSTVGNDDAFIGLRNERVIHNQVHAQMLRLLSSSVDHYCDMNKRSLDHFGALPPISARGASGTGA